MIVSAIRRVAAALFLWTAFFITGGCTATYREPEETAATPSYRVVIAEPALNEVVIVINNNAGFGTHAGMFVGSRLFDPAGGYVNARQMVGDWNGPTLRDYIQFQLEDGNRIQTFRFVLTPEDISVVDLRVANAGMGKPLYCAADVRDQIAGVGPFKALAAGEWLSPAGLADLLLPYVEGPGAAGACVWANGAPCRRNIRQ